MECTIFDVEHGACALITGDDGAQILVDCGHNSTTGWRPSTHLPANGVQVINRLFITNLDEDHVSDLAGLQRAVFIETVHSNRSISANDIRRLKSEHGAGPGIDAAISMLGTTHTVLEQGVPNHGPLTFNAFCNNYPDDFDDENNLSLVVFFHCHGLHIVFPGDLESAGWDKLLLNAQFRAELARVNVFVASHHGRESGYNRAVFDYCTPQIVIASDCSIRYDTQLACRSYADHASGMPWGDGTQKVFTTRRHGRIRLVAVPGHTELDTDVA